MINSESLLYFIELTKTLNMTRAAERLGVTQPTLSHSLRRLEQEVGSELFKRSKKGLSLTFSGERFLEKSQELLHLWESIRSSVHSENNDIKGRIRLGCHSAVAQYTLPVFLPQLLNKNAELKVNLSHGLSRHMTEMVVTDQLDVALAVNPRPHPDLIIKELARDKVTVWSAKNNLNTDVLFIEPELLQSQDILVKLSKKNIYFSRLIESSSLEVIAQMLVAGAGCAILPERVVQAFSNEKINAMKNAPVFEDRICAVYKPEFRKIKRGQVFLQTLWDAFHK